MGDERSCPECGARLGMKASHCDCGWGRKPAGQQSAHNMRCDWHSGQLQCRYPVGRFDVGCRSGFCLFHRSTPAGIDAARIAEESQLHTPEQYLGRATAHTYGATVPPVVRALRERLRDVKTGKERPSLFATILPPRATTERTSADEHIARADAARLEDINAMLAEAARGG